MLTPRRSTVAALTSENQPQWHGQCPAPDQHRACKIIWLDPARQLQVGGAQNSKN